MPFVLLFNPPTLDQGGFTREGRCTQESGIWATQWPPVTLATAAALLGREGHRTRVVDFPALSQNMDALAAVLESDPPDYAFWSTGTPTLESDLAVARLVKEVSPNTVTGVMGTHVTVHPEQALAEPALNLVVRREPEGVLRDICRSGRTGWDTVRGISCRDHQGGVRHNPDAGFLAPEAIPAPDWQSLDISPYRLPLKGRPFLIVAPVRGCPYPCSFCTASIYYGKPLRKRPVAAVVDEIAANIEQHRIRDFFIWADTFTADKEYVMDFCHKIMEQGLKISWTCNSRVDTVDQELLALMKKAGLWMISFGLESGNDMVLDKTGKGISTAQSRAAVSAARRVGIRTAGHFILGLPGDTPATMEQTLAFAMDTPLDIAQFYAAAPFPGTRLFAEAHRSGWLQEAGPCSQGRAVLQLPDLTPAQVNGFRQRAYRKFYLRPAVLFRLLTMMEPRALLQLSSKMIPFLRTLLRR